MNLYRPDTDPKYQRGGVPNPPSDSEGLVISPDTSRSERLPEGQHRTPKWPVLHAGRVPDVDVGDWSLRVCGLVDQESVWSLEEFRQLPRTRVFGDFHCVTAWSRLGNLWEGVSVPWLLKQVGLRPEAKFARILAADDEWTTNVPVASLLEEDVVLADSHDGQPLDADHGGPVRLVVPRLFAWKSAKWICAIEFTTDDQPGYWEQLGYHNVGDPWKGQRYRDDPDWLASH